MILGILSFLRPVLDELFDAGVLAAFADLFPPWAAADVLVEEGGFFWKR